MNVQRLKDAAWVIAVADQAERSRVAAASSVSRRRPNATVPVVATSGSLAQVMQSGSYGCSAEVAALVKQYFPNDYTFWFQVVIPRESHCQPGAQNLREGCDTSGRTNSHAVGLVQLCMPLHDAAFSAVGCSNWQDLNCYMKAWRYLVDTEGRAPWGG